MSEKELSWPEVFELSKKPTLIALGALVGWLVLAFVIALVVTLPGIIAQGVGLLFELAVFAYIGHELVGKQGLSVSNARRVAAFAGVLRNAVLVALIGVPLLVLGAGSLASAGVGLICLPVIAIIVVLFGGLDGAIGGWIGAKLAEGKKPKAHHEGA